MRGGGIAACMRGCTGGSCLCLPGGPPTPRITPTHPLQVQIAVKACREGAGQLEEIQFSLFEAKAVHAWAAAARAAGLVEEAAAEAAEEAAAEAAEEKEEESSGGSRASEKEEL